MPKRVVAVTNIKKGNGPEDFFAAGSQIPAGAFTKEQLIELHDAGAIEVVIEEDPVVEAEPVVVDSGTTPLATSGNGSPGVTITFESSEPATSDGAAEGDAENGATDSASGEVKDTDK